MAGLCPRSLTPLPPTPHTIPSARSQRLDLEIQARTTPPHPILSTMFDRPVRISLAQALVALSGETMSPHSPQDLFALAAHFIWGFQERYQLAVPSKSPSGLAKHVHSRLTSAQRAAVANVCESEYRIVCSLKFATLADHIHYRAAILKECLTCMARLIMHWYSEERLPPHQTNCPMTVNPQIRCLNEVSSQICISSFCRI